MNPGAADARPALVVASGGVGPALRAARERRGLSIAAVTETLHVEARVLEAMEAGRFTVFDAPVYARGFIRKYASFLELPVADMIAAYDALSSGPSTPSLIPPATAQAPPRDLSTLRLPLIFVLALIVLGASFWWWIGRSAARHEAPATVATALATNAATDPAPAVAGEPDPVVLPPPGREAPAEAPVQPRPAATQRSAARVASATPRAAQHASVLVVHGLRECWVEVYSSSGARLLYDLVQPGDSHALPGPGPWKVFLGNADGVRLSMDERTIALPVAVRAGATARFQVAGDGAVK